MTEKVTAQNYVIHDKPRGAELSLGHVILGKSLTFLVGNTWMVTMGLTHVGTVNPMTRWVLPLEPVLSLSRQGL